MLQLREPVITRTQCGKGSRFEIPARVGLPGPTTEPAPTLSDDLTGCGWSTRASPADSQFRQSTSGHLPASTAESRDPMGLLEEAFPSTKPYVLSDYSLT